MFKSETSSPRRIVITANDNFGMIWAVGEVEPVKNLDLITLTELRDALNGAIDHITREV